MRVARVRVGSVRVARVRVGSVRMEVWSGGIQMKWSSVDLLFLNSPNPENSG